MNPGRNRYTVPTRQKTGLFLSWYSRPTVLVHPGGSREIVVGHTYSTEVIESIHRGMYAQQRKANEYRFEKGKGTCRVH